MPQPHRPTIRNIHHCNSMQYTNNSRAVLRQLVRDRQCQFNRNAHQFKKSFTKESPVIPTTEAALCGCRFLGALLHHEDRLSKRIQTTDKKRQHRKNTKTDAVYISSQYSAQKKNLQIILKQRGNNHSKAPPFYDPLFHCLLSPHGDVQTPVW